MQLTGLFQFCVFTFDRQDVKIVINTGILRILGGGGLE